MKKKKGKRKSKEDKNTRLQIVVLKKRHRKRHIKFSLEKYNKITHRLVQKMNHIKYHNI